ncbi:MAG: 3-demethylubiquinone-9 3-O-methyltransferase [Deltaproteobacteria bacterium HGW-Deltaproteobacteria-21]|nr:MAG: 3-demethylubiquinone-9 3-O-methyltransferase [Deltaproteobacteria bacterium HGW-Deltaproteobacteria-21]
MHQETAHFTHYGSQNPSTIPTLLPTYPEFHGGSTQWWPVSGDHVFLYRLNPVRFEYFDRFMGNWRDVEVLDVGCGGGYVCEFLARRGAVVSGTDIMAEAIQEARAHAAQENLKIEYHPCTAERLPLNDHTVDAVTCVDVLEHVSNKAQTLSEIHRVLKPGGWIFFDTFNKTFWSKFLILWLGERLIRFMARGTHYWPYFIRPDDLRLLLEESGFRSVEFAGIELARKARGKSGPPFTISPNGHTAVIYFGAARKPIC